MEIPMKEDDFDFATEGHFINAEFLAESLKGQAVWDQEENTLIFKNSDGHGGGDNYIMKELFETMTAGVEPKCSGSEGLESAILALGIDKAARTGSIVDLEPVWKQLGR